MLPTTEPWGSDAKGRSPLTHWLVWTLGPLDSALQAVRTLGFSLPRAPVPVGDSDCAVTETPSVAGHRRPRCLRQFTPQARERGLSGTAEPPCRVPLAGGLPVARLVSCPRALCERFRVPTGSHTLCAGRALCASTAAQDPPQIVPSEAFWGRNDENQAACV